MGVVATQGVQLVRSSGSIKGSIKLATANKQIMDIMHCIHLLGFLLQVCLNPTKAGPRILSDKVDWSESHLNFAEFPGSRYAWCRTVSGTLQIPEAP